MMRFIHGTLDSQARLELPGGLAKDWIDPEDERCVVEARPPGCLFITSLRKWAEMEELEVEDAEARIASPWEHGLEPPGLPAIWLAKLSRVNRKGPGAKRITLPTIAIWALLEQGQGPKAPKGNRTGVVVLMGTDAQGLYVWSDSGRGWMQ